MKSKMLLGVLLFVSSVIWAASVATAAPTGTGKYELSSFIANFIRFKPGDKVPPLYLTEKYTTKQWDLRSLSVPATGAHWTYMDDTYVLINDTDVRTIKAYDSEIFYHRRKNTHSL